MCIYPFKKKKKLMAIVILNNYFFIIILLGHFQIGGYVSKMMTTTDGPSQGLVLDSWALPGNSFILIYQYFLNRMII